ncbi:HEAT repeat domain-containing protein [Cellvibrio sp. UBA7671]|uniref:HEAT repeat domain-containing protein n=1 Tax=Cellvibrio sp. UBA7671 TaxID=1946312 RepID=UPI002F3581B5
MSNPRYSNKHLLLAAFIGATVSYGVLNILLDGSAQREKIIALEHKVHALESTQKPVTLPADKTAPQALDIEQIRKDLSTRFIGDPRSFGEKLRDFVAENTHPQTIAIACKVVADLAENPDTLTNQELDSLYRNQTNPELKRVLAQVLSLRGDNNLMHMLVAEAQPGLRSTNPAVRRQTLNDLAKTHYAGAAAAIVPLVQDSDTSVILDALLALRATGNESHIPSAENLLSHPDQSVSWLANDVINHLQNLSTKARTKLTSADVAAELPPL